MMIPGLRTKGGMNSREQWRERAARVRSERDIVRWSLHGGRPPTPPCSVLLTRIAPSNGLDDDNLRGALKAVRDQVADWLGVDDRSPLVLYRYAQMRGDWGVMIQFGPLAVAVDAPLETFADLVEAK